MPRSKCIFYLFFIAIFFSTISFANTSNQHASSTFLTIADIHFSPFYTCKGMPLSCAIVDKLRKAPASEWKNIFVQYDRQNPVYGKETGFTLLESGLAEFKKQAIKNHVQFVLVLGDLLAHNYKIMYQFYTGDISAEGAQSFVDKTMKFIMSELQRTFSNLDVYTVIGNNDAYAKHYVFEPQFYKNMAPIWEQVIKDKKSKIKMQQMFSRGGYYSLDIPRQKNLRLIVLNTTLFARLTKEANVEAQNQLAWLHAELASLSSNHQKALIALHIPSGVDIYKTIKQGEVIEFWHDQYTKRFLAELKQYASSIIGVFPGHVHADWFQVLKSTDASKAVLVTATPAISPQYGNNPGFKIYRYGTRSLLLEDYVTYFYPLDSKYKQWQVEYDFNKIYQPHCHHCKIVDGMNLIHSTGELANKYKKFYAVGQNAQPITRNNKWKLYWCAIPNIVASEYMACVKS